VKRLLIALAGALGLRALLRRRKHEPPAEPPVDELREKLAAAKAEDVTPEPATVEERRADVHDRARRAMDELGGDA
jgi:uncharacterized membrane protein YccC